MLKDWSKAEKPYDAEIDSRLEKARSELNARQMAIKENKLPVLVIFDGWGGAGKGGLGPGQGGLRCHGLLQGQEHDRVPAADALRQGLVHVRGADDRIVAGFSQDRAAARASRGEDQILHTISIQKRDD